ncbi:MAG: SpoIIE family protein phosphatase, partial [Planctomycetota bacterium]
AEDGSRAWAAFEDQSFDAVITDWEMPGLGGCDLIRRIRAADLDRYVYVILLTSRSETEDVVAGLEAGADDFLSKPFDKGELRARLAAGERVVRLERDLAGANRRMARDLEAGAKYVRSMIPPPMKDRGLAVDWLYVPADDLAGDSLGYHWIDSDRFAIYVLDVTGHGLDAALLSVMVLNALRTMTLPDTDFARPDQVLAALNDRFPMEEHQDRCFTIWYGVFDRRDRSLVWSGGGHHDALLHDADGGERRLASSGPMMGMLPGADFPADSLTVPSSSRLFVFTDGVFEVEDESGVLGDFERFAQRLAGFCRDDAPLDRMWRVAQGEGPDAPLDDDFTVLMVDIGS